MSAQAVQLPPGCKIVEAPAAPQPPTWFEDYGDLLTTRDVAEIIQQSAQTVRRLMGHGEIPACPIGRRWYTPKSELVKFIERGLGDAA